MRYQLCSILLGVLLAMTATAQDMYRSTASGLWHNASTWQRFDGTNWVAAMTYPTATNSTSIQVRSPHTVTLTNAVGSIVMDDLTVEAGANLTNQSGCHSFNDGAAAVLRVIAYVRAAAIGFHGKFVSALASGDNALIQETGFKVKSSQRTLAFRQNCFGSIA